MAGNSGTMTSNVVDPRKVREVNALSVADPGFPRGGGANPPGAPTYDFAKFPQKQHEIESILTPGVGSLILPLRSATDYGKLILKLILDLQT